MSRLLQLYEGYEGVFDGIVQRLRGDAGFKGLFQSCRALHSSQLFLSKMTTLKVHLRNKEQQGVAAQLATVPRGAHITKLTLKSDYSCSGHLPHATAFQQGVVAHLNCWKPGMLDLQKVTTLEFQGVDTYEKGNGAFGGTLHAAFPHLQHIVMDTMGWNERLLCECAYAGLQLRSLVVACDTIIGPDDPLEYFNLLGSLRSLESLTIRAHATWRESHLPLSQLANLTSFSWDIIPEITDEIQGNDSFHDVIPAWQKLTHLSLLHCDQRLPQMPHSLKRLHIQCLRLSGLSDLHPLPKGLDLHVDNLILDCSFERAALIVLANWERLCSAGIAVKCNHVRLLCGSDEDDRGPLRDVLPLLARHSHAFVQAGTHHVSVMHVSVPLGELEQLSSIFNGVSKLGLVNYSLASLSVVEEVARMPGLHVLELRSHQDSRQYACEVHAACVAGQGRLQPLPLTIEFDFYPFPDDQANDYTKFLAKQRDLIQTWEAAASSSPAKVTLRGVPHKFTSAPALNNEVS